MKHSDFKICPICNRANAFHWIRCEPATDLELQRIQRARETGKAPKPSWYTAPSLPAARVHSIKQKFPGYVLAMFTKQSNPGLEREFPNGAKNAKAYVKLYDRMNHLQPVKVNWIKTDGNFG